MTYLDLLSKKGKRSRHGPGSDSDSDDGPPPDPDDPASQQLFQPKKERKPTAEAREVQVSAKKTDDKSGLQPLQGGLSSTRRDILQALRREDEEMWTDLEYHDEQVRSQSSDQILLKSSLIQLEQSGESLRCFDLMCPALDDTAEIPLLDCKGQMSSYLAAMESQQLSN